MVFKKKRRVRDLLRAALVILLCVGVPIWLLMIAMITQDALVCLFMMDWCFVSYLVSWMVENE